jgi:two-component system nitrogen regulation response regulator GlnG
MTTAKDATALPRDAAKRTFDAVIIEAKPGMHNGSGGLPHHVDLSRTLVITGSKPVLKRASKFMQTIARAKGTVSDGAPAPMSLEDYVEWKMGDFVKGMRNGSGRNLHPMLISAIERPLITKALQETKGNQIQAAELLGVYGRPSRSGPRIQQERSLQGSKWWRRFLTHIKEGDDDERRTDCKDGSVCRDYQGGRWKCAPCFYRSGDLFSEKRTASVAGQLRDLHDFQAQGEDGTESADGGEPQNSRGKSAEVLSRESFEVGCPVTSGSPLTTRRIAKREKAACSHRSTLPSLCIS